MNKIYFFINQSLYQSNFDEMIKQEYNFIDKITKTKNKDQYVININLVGNTIDKSTFDDITKSIRSILNDKINTFYKIDKNTKYLYRNLVKQPIVQIQPITKKYLFINDD
jgi:ribosomal protein S3AE